MRKNDRGFKNLLKNLRKDDGLIIEAGIFAGSKANRSANGSAADDLAYRLKIHDQGLGDNPERQVLAPALEMTRADADKALSAHMKRMDRSGDFGAKAKSLGARFAANIQKQFASTTPQKLQSTVRAAERRYGGTRNTNLIQTGEMRQAVTFRVS